MFYNIDADVIVSRLWTVYKAHWLTHVGHPGQGFFEGYN